MLDLEMTVDRKVTHEPAFFASKTGGVSAVAGLPSLYICVADVRIRVEMIEYVCFVDGEGVGHSKGRSIRTESWWGKSRASQYEQYEQDEPSRM